MSLSDNKHMDPMHGHRQYDHSSCHVSEPCEHPIDRLNCGPNSDGSRQRARLARVKAKDGGWGQLVVKREPGGLRHYLDGQPIHCGAGLLLQHVLSVSDDYGEYTVCDNRGTAVRYEASQDGTQIRFTLYADIGGHEFIAHGEPWYRFRWPGSSR